MLPVLYSYRRCPYAMRARMALKIAEIEVEIREISLRNKPRHMLQISTKGTVPVLLLPDGDVIDESLAIMLFALQAHAMGANIHADARAYDLVLENDSSFKRALDAYKYPERNKNKTQEQHRADGEVFLQKLENLLQKDTFLLGGEVGIADIAIFPFIRQFAAVNPAWFEKAPYSTLKKWLSDWINSDLFTSVMQKHAIYTGD